METRDLIFGLAHIGINVPDLEASVAFYRDLFGFEVTQTNYDSEGRPHIIFMSKCGVVLELIHVAQEEARATVDAASATNNHVALACADTARFMETLRARGIPCETDAPKVVENFGRPDVDIHVVFLRGPAGERVEVFQQVTKW